MKLAPYHLFFGSLLYICPFALFAQPAALPEIPAVYSNLGPSDTFFIVNGRNERTFVELERPPRFTLEQMQGDPQGTATGLQFDFGPDFFGTLYYGFIPSGDSKYPHPVYFRSPSPIDSGRAEINIARNLSGLYDMVGWQESGRGTLGYRVVDATGLIMYDGKVTFYHRDSFEVAPTLIEGPYLNQIRPDGAVIAFTTNRPYLAQVRVGDRVYYDEQPGVQHEIYVEGLEPATLYDYSIFMGDTMGTYSLRTAPLPGARSRFTFAYASDSRSGQGGGERDVYGANFYIMKKILALCTQQKAAFLQFTGDLIDGYLSSPAETDLQYANWKRAVEPFWHHLPIYPGMGNHEAVIRAFVAEDFPSPLMIDRFPFDTESAEAVFARHFVNATNGPESEDGAAYDPDASRIDFPSYRENVFHYRYDNVAMIVLNSDYFYAPSTMEVRTTSGNIHGYIMDRQLEWLQETVQQYEQDPTIDHIFVTQHTPCFPNGGHVRDDMWYNGNNQIRPYVSGKPMPKGIIERRDQILDIIVNNSRKVRAILTGDEHNYCRTHLTPETKIYPEPYFFPKIELTRDIYQINNGAAGAPYYSQEQTPWTPYTSNFTTQNAVVFIHVEGESVEVEVLNPDTLEEVDRFKLN